MKQACFFEWSHFGGDHFCVGTGTVNALPGGWDNAISSFRLINGATLRACDGANMTARCRDYDARRATLGAADNRITSFRVR